MLDMTTLNKLHNSAFTPGGKLQKADGGLPSAPRIRGTVRDDGIPSGAAAEHRVGNLIRAADFHDSGACVENIEYHDDRRLDRQITRLASCSYIDSGQNVILIGASGCGKSFSSCAL